MKHGALLRLQFLNSEDYPGMYERRVQYRRPFIQGQFHEFVPERQKPSDHDEDSVMVEVAKAINKIQVAENDPKQIEAKRMKDHAERKRKEDESNERERLRKKKEREERAWWFEDNRARIQKAIDHNMAILADHSKWDLKLLPISDFEWFIKEIRERGYKKIGKGRYVDPDGFQWQTCNYNGLSGSDEMFALLSANSIQETLSNLHQQMLNLYYRY